MSDSSIFDLSSYNPLRRLCMSRARHAGEIAFLICPAITLCGDRACRERDMQVRLRF